MNELAHPGYHETEELAHPGCHETEAVKRVCYIAEPLITYVMEKKRNNNIHSADMFLYKIANTAPMSR